MSKRIGRPSAYGPAITEEICNQIAEGKGLHKVCRAPGMPSPCTVYRWLAEHPDFRRRYEIAREWQAEHYADEIMEIADNCTGDWITRPDGSRVFDASNVEVARIQIYARMWLAARLAPKKYGKRPEIVTPPAPPPTITVVMPDRERAEAAIALVKRAAA